MRNSYTKRNLLNICIVLLILLVSLNANSQTWSGDGNSYYKIEENNLIKYSLPANQGEIIIPAEKLIPKGDTAPIKISYFKFSDDEQKLLLFTNTKKVWRLKTRGDYWILDLNAGTLKQLGKNLQSSSLMFAKISPDGNRAAYVSGNNIYVEDLKTSKIKALTANGSETITNGTFDWVYEEEFFCRDGFRWSPDSKSIAYWQLDASSIKKFYMINNTDSAYSQLIPLEYPKVGEKPSVAKIGVVNVSTGKTVWMKIPGEPDQNYLVRMEFIPSSNKLLIQQLNRKQNHSKLFVADIFTGSTKIVQEEMDKSWVDLITIGYPYAIDYKNDFIWINKNKSILWISEKDGWRHMYQVSLEDNNTEKIVTRGNYDVIDYKFVNEEYVYFMASPFNATQSYLYRANLDGSGEAEMLSPAVLKGTHNYTVAPGGKYAIHTFSNHFTKRAKEYIKLPDHEPLNEKESILAALDTLTEEPATEFFRIKTCDSIEMDGWMVKPKDFDPAKKYPVVFYVYTEPAATTVNDYYGISMNDLYIGDMAQDGYIYISLDGRGTPAPKGSEWRKSIYKKIGQVNIRDQAMAAKEILKWNFVDTQRVAVWGWSGGGSATLNLMFQYPEIYKTGIAIAAVTNLLTYDNIYQERYMGLPQENMEAFVKGSPVTYAKNLTGNLLYIHGTGDDNVHYQNAEILVDELVKYKRQFQFMPYPNRTHNISEGEGTLEHLMTLYTNYLRLYCPPGGK